MLKIFKVPDRNAVKQTLRLLLFIGFYLGMAGVLWISFQTVPIRSVNAEISIHQEAPEFLFAIYGDEKKDWLGGKKASPDSLKRPLAVAGAPDGRIFVADTGNSQIQVFSGDGKKVSSFGRGKLNYPFALAYRDHKVYVADPNLMKVFVFDDNGSELPPLLDKTVLPRKWGPASDVIRPTAIQAGQDGLFYVADVANQSVIVLDSQGQIKLCFGGPGTRDGNFQYPNGLWIDQKGNIYVADSNNGRIQVFDNKGKFLQKIDGSRGKNGPLSLPRGLFVTDDGLLIVVDVFMHSVRAFDALGHEIWAIGGMGTENGQFNFPNGLCLDAQGRLYVTDRENNRVQVFGYPKK